MSEKVKHEKTHVKKYHKATFDRISEKKRERILQTAFNEFAEKGLKGANINVIAKKANISIGSLYNYFPSKDKLFLALVDTAYKHLETALGSADIERGNIFDKLESLLWVALRFSRERPELINLYMEICAEPQAKLAKELSLKLENISAVFYRKQLEEAQKQGIVRSDIDNFVTTFCIDNIIMLMQFSYTSQYYMHRLKTFVGEKAHQEDERVVKGIMAFIRSAIEKRG